MKKPKRYWTEAGPLYSLNKFVSDDSGAGVLYMIPMGFVTLAVALIAEIFLNGIAVGAVVIITLIIMIILPLLNLFSPLRKINNDGNWRNGYSGSRDLVRKIFALPKEDQRNFPYNLVETLSRDIPMDERIKINIRIQKTLDEIKKRDKLLYEASQRAIPTDGVINSLDERLASLTTETDTIRELL